MSQLPHHNPEINWKTGKVKIMRYPEECGKQWRPKQGKPVQQKQKEEEKKKSKSKEKKSKSKSKERKKEEIKRKQDNGCEESSGRVGNLG